MMKKKILLSVAFAVTVFATVNAQVAVTPEVPRNYKPQPKELIPMPAELTDQMIFPVLGKYEFTNSDGEIATVVISRDVENKGLVWVNGMPQGKFKANLKAFPATYKIPEQKTLINESIEVFSSNPDSAKVIGAVRYSGKSLKEGTVVFDSTSNKLYINIDGKYKEDNPSSVFPELMTYDQTEKFSDTEQDNATSKKSNKKKTVSTGTNYVLTKMVDVNTASLKN